MIHGLMHPRISLSFESPVPYHGWADIPLSAGPTHGRRGSVYRAQSAALAGAFGDEEDNAERYELRPVREDEEEDGDVNERTRLRQGDDLQGDERRQ